MPDLLTYFGAGGTLARRGAYVQPPPPDIIHEDLETQTIVSTLGTNPAGVNEFRSIVHDPAYGYIQAQHALMAVEDLGAPHGRVVKVTYKNNWYQSSTNNGIAYAPTLPRSVEAIRVSQWIRFRSGFVSAKGGKFGVGVGWRNDWASISTGGASNNHAGSFRWMWRDDFRVSPYLYDANGTAGVGLATAPTVYTPNDFDWHHYQFDVILNTATVVAGPKGTTAPSPGTLGNEYLADGTLICRVDGAVIMEHHDRVLRKYADTVIPQMTWSWFRGGGDSTWDAATGDNYIDLGSYTMDELL